ncbi:MAG: class II aldolase/adducin family protein [Burkholderiales bacterium]|nr:class II aldolase/adducin family protein [Burkholderiales bacterium]
MTPPDEALPREQAVAAIRRLDALGLNRGSTGNLSLRCARGGRPGLLITPTGMGADDLRAQDMVWMGEDGAVEGEWLPSSEWHFHRAVLQRRADVQAVVHTHSVHATALACLERPLPAFHYMVAVAGVSTVPCTPYHTFGSEALSLAVADALQDGNACLMAHHGLVAAAPSLAQAMKIAIEIESLCEVYLKALAVGEPATLSAAQMAEVLHKFSGYGRSRRA